MKDIVNKIIHRVYKIFFQQEPSFAVDFFVKNLSFVAMGFGISALLGIMTQIMAGRILGPLECGKYYLIQSTAAFLSLPMLFGISTALTKYGAEKENFEDRKKIISTSYLIFISLSATFLIFFVFFAKPISGILKIPFELYIYSVIFSFLFCSYAMSISIIQGLRKMKILSIFQAIYGLIGILTFLIFLYFKVSSFKAIFFASSINYSIIFILTIFIFKKYFSFDFDRNLGKKILRYGFYASIGALASAVYFNFDRIIINNFFGAAEVGIYGSYYIAFIASAGFIFNTFNLVFFPMVSSTKDKNIIFKKINKIVFKLSLFVFLIMFIAGVIVLKFYGKKYQLNFGLCFLFDIASVLSLINLIYGWCMSAVGEKGAKIVSVSAIVTAIVNVLVNILLVPRIGSFGSVIAIILSYSASIIIIISQREYYKSKEVFVSLSA